MDIRDSHLLRFVISSSRLQYSTLLQPWNENSTSGPGPRSAAWVNSAVQNQNHSRI